MIHESIPKDAVLPADYEHLLALVAKKGVLADDFVHTVQLSLARKHTDAFGGGIHPLFLHFDEIGTLDRPSIVAKHVPAGVSPRVLFYSFWDCINSIIKIPNCFVYLSGKNSQLEVVGHHNGGLSVGYVERLFLEPLTSQHIMQMLAKPLPRADFGKQAMSQVVFGVDPQKLTNTKLHEYKLLQNLAELVIRVTGGLPRAIGYSFGWFQTSMNNIAQVREFLDDTVKVLFTRFSFLSFATVFFVRSTVRLNQLYWNTCTEFVNSRPLCIRRCWPTILALGLHWFLPL